MALSDALVEFEVEAAAQRVTDAEGPLVERLQEAWSAALLGSYPAAQVVVRAWDKLLEELLGAAAAKVHGAIVVEHGRVRQVAGHDAVWVNMALGRAVVAASVSPFVASLGAGAGMAVGCVATIRELVPEFAPLAPPRTGLPVLPEGADVMRFARNVDLVIRQMQPELERIQEALGLSASELGALFGVTRQAVEGWRVKGIPADRRAAVGDAIAAVELLERKLKPGRLALMARRPAAAFGGHSLIEFAGQSHHAELRRVVESAFDWSTTA